MDNASLRTALLVARAAESLGCLQPGDWPDVAVSLLLEGPEDPAIAELAGLNLDCGCTEVDLDTEADLQSMPTRSTHRRPSQTTASTPGKFWLHHSPESNMATRDIPKSGSAGAGHKGEFALTTLRTFGVVITLAAAAVVTTGAPAIAAPCGHLLQGTGNPYAYYDNCSDATYKIKIAIRLAPDKTLCVSPGVTDIGRKAFITGAEYAGGDGCTAPPR
ncbi:DUF6355 family natural product biosynthesis protein [Amycolatopsis sp. NPDC058278]|uniref:DUF6355 family natural product biosynthesis protein n=1 Tax=Amycolatopsis sp. NPDC058278 TaxID=3346417 RepID=UPI0036DC9CE6